MAKPDGTGGDVCEGSQSSATPDKAPSKSEVLAKLDARHLAEYVAFSGQVREYVNDTLGKAFRADPNPIRRRHHVIQLVQRRPRLLMAS